MYYLIFLLAFSPNNVRFLDAGGQGKLFHTEAECYTAASSIFDLVKAAHPDASVTAICPKIPLIST